MKTLLNLLCEFALTKSPYKRKRLQYLIRKGLAYLFLYIPLTWYYKRTRKQETFKIAGKEYYYHYGLYNATWRNERAVEVPIVKDLLWQWRGMRILEVGNVTGHYFRCSHDILDRYERGTGILREDIVNFSPLVKYDLIVSISTLEHIGWDETPRQPEKLLKALDSLRRNVLQPRGKMLVTLPLGHNNYLDGLLEKGKLPFDSIHCLQRDSHHSKEWQEASWSPEKVKEAKCKEGYGTTIVVIATLKGIGSHEYD